MSRKRFVYYTEGQYCIIRDSEEINSFEYLDDSLMLTNSSSSDMEILKYLNLTQIQIKLEENI